MLIRAHSRSKERSRRGNLLLQAILGLLVMTTGGVFISKMLLQSQKFERGIAADSDSREIASIIQLMTGSRAACGRTTLVGLNLSPLLRSSPTPVSVNLRLLAADGSLSGPDLGPGKLYANRTIETFEFNQLIPIQGSDYFANLEMDAPVRGTAVSIKSSIKSFLLRVTLDSGGLVTACSGSSDWGGGGSGAGSLAALLGVPNADNWPDIIACGDGSYHVLSTYNGGNVLYHAARFATFGYCSYRATDGSSPPPVPFQQCPAGCRVNISAIPSFMNFR